MGVEIPFVRELDFEYGRVDRVSPLIRRVVANNPGPFTLYGTGTYVIGNGRVAVVDPGPELPEHIDALAAALEGEEITHMLVTHTHNDHSPGCRLLSRITDARTYGYGPHGAGKREEGVQVEEGGDMAFVPDREIRHGDVIEGDGWSVECVYTPGHTSNHICFALREEQILFSGDHVMGWSTSVISPPDGDMTAYMRSLELLLEREDAAYWPTHGPRIDDPKAHVRAFIAHREEREAQILRCLSDGVARIAEMVPRMYIGLDPRLTPAAARSVYAAMLRLVDNGRVVSEGEPRVDSEYRAAEARPVRDRTRVVLMVVDGLRGDMVDPALTPAIAALARRARQYRAHRSVFPSATRVNSASIATGCFPARHGLAGNAIALDEGSGLTPVSVGPPEFRERWRRATGRTLLCPTLAERLRGRGGARIYTNSSAGAAHMQDPDQHGWLLHRSGSWAPGGVPAAALPATYDGAGDWVVTERFCAELTERPDAAALWTLWICEPDHSQHALELGSPEHRAVLAGADACVAQVAEAVAAVRSRDQDVLLIVCSDHGHETVESVVPVESLLIEAGLKAHADSSDTVLASSGMGALVYLSEESRGRLGELERWLSLQPWTERVYSGTRLAEVGQAARSSLAVAFSMAKRPGANRYGVPGLGLVAGDRFMRSDAPGLGQHGGLGRYETNPALLIDGRGFPRGHTAHPSRAVDIAPSVLFHLGVPSAGMDGAVLQRSV